MNAHDETYGVAIGYMGIVPTARCGCGFRAACRSALRPFGLHSQYGGKNKKKRIQDTI